MLFTGPKVLLDLPKSELLKMQEKEIQAAVLERRVDFVKKDHLEADHVEEV